MPGLTNLTRLNYLDISYGKSITDESLRSVFKLTDLKYLNIFRCDRITGETFMQISQLKKLEYLDAGASDSFPPGYLTSLEILPNLVSLEFWYYDGISDEDFKMVGKLTQLTKLVALVGNNVTARGLDYLSNLSNMIDLEIEYEKERPSALNDSYYQHLFHLTRLATKIDEKNVTTLTRLHNLRELQIATKVINQEFFMNLAKLTALSSLDLDATVETGLGFTKLTVLSHLTSLLIDKCSIDDNWDTPYNSRKSSGMRFN